MREDWESYKWIGNRIKLKILNEWYEFEKDINEMIWGNDWMMRSYELC